jgi:hypothetical protein
LVQFLIDRATSNPVLGTSLHWYVQDIDLYIYILTHKPNRYLMVECEDKIGGKLYAKVAYHYLEDLLQVKITFSRYFIVTIMKINHFQWLRRYPMVMTEETF